MGRETGDQIAGFAGEDFDKGCFIEMGRVGWIWGVAVNEFKEARSISGETKISGRLGLI